MNGDFFFELKILLRMILFYNLNYGENEDKGEGFERKDNYKIVREGFWLTVLKMIRLSNIDFCT